MTTGIYKLTFGSGKVYVGQSVDIENRFEEHKRNLQTGKASIAMLKEYRLYGFPIIDILLECHQDHLNFAEAAYIHTYARYGSLNTFLPKAPTDWEIAVFNRSSGLLKNSLPGLLDLINRQGALISDFPTVIDDMEKVQKEELEKTANGQEVLRLRLLNETLKEELKIERNKPWYKKLFS